MANVDIIIRMIDKTGAAKNSTTANLKSMAATLATVTAAATAIGYAMKKAFDLGKEGAMLEFTATKFDRLAQSIGTTADVLLKDLRKATGGIYSDMELMASATDMVGLGLANTHDEAVRLAAVSGGLNMNMNQLVLTLTNMTTMRFDALGVRVDGFKEKVKALEKQGYSTNDAFKEAFLQQAEDQLELVGNAADTTLGSYMKLEAAVKNNTDAMKRSFSEGFEPLVKVLGVAATEYNRIFVGLKETDPYWHKLWVLTGQLTPEMRKAVDVYWAAQDAIEGQTGAIERNIVSLEAQAEALKEVSKINQAMIGLIRDIQSAQEKYKSEYDSIMGDINLTEEERISKLGDLEAEHKRVNNGILSDLVERKLMQDGVLDDAEFEWLVKKRVEWGIYSEEAAAAARLVWAEADHITASIANIPTEKTSTINLITNQTTFKRFIALTGGSPGRAAGGPVSSGMPYMVGERGPEIFVPNSSGNIVPNGRTPNQPMIDYRKMSRAIVQALQQSGG